VKQVPPLAVFQVYLELVPPPLETSQSNTVNQEEGRNTNRESAKQILIGQRARWLNKEQQVATLAAIK
jgi:hypothetical protein